MFNSGLSFWRKLVRNRIHGSSTRKPGRNARRRLRQRDWAAAVERLEDRTLLSSGSLDPTFGNAGKVLTDIGAPGSSDIGREVVAYQSDGKSIVVGESHGDMVAVRYNTDGSLDTTFGSDGVVRIDFGGSSDVGLSVAVDSADRVLVAGHSSRGATGWDFAVARLTTAGALDTNFDSDGRQTIDFGNTFDIGQSVAVDSADRVLVAGYSNQGSTGYDFAVARLTTGGALDTSFDGDGRQTVNFGIHEFGHDVAVDSADRVLVGGYSYRGSTGYDFTVARLTKGGALDTSFDGDGRQTIDFGNTDDIGQSVAVDSADRVLVGGYSYRGSTGYDFAVARLTTAGGLDTSFDGDGRQTIDFGSTSDIGYSVAVDSADRVLVGGYSYQGSTGYDFAVARLTTAGALDTGFDSDGKQTIDFGSSSDTGQSVAVDSADRVLVGGDSSQASTGRDFAVARLTRGGALDTSFDSDGKVTTDIGLLTSDIGRDVVAYQSDGKSIVVGESHGDMVAVRYNTDGSLDTTFGTNGIVRIDFGGTFDAGFSVAVDSADRVLLAGYSDQGATDRDFAVARLTTGGALDTSFDGDGRQTIDFGGTFDIGFSVAVDSADRVLVAGYSNQGLTGNDFAVARLTTAGALDTSFDSDGKQTIDFSSSSDIGFSVAVDSADRVLVAGHSYQGATGWDFAVARLTTGGALDASFDGDGKQTIDFSSSNDIGFSVAVDSAGRVLVAGYSVQGLTGNDFAVARLTAAGALDTSFDSDGRQTIDFSSSSDIGLSVAVDSADRVLVGGHSNQGSTGYDFAVARLTTGGALDTSFDGDGRQTIDFGSFSDHGWSVAVDSAGRVLVAGYSNQGSPTGTDFAVARLLSNAPPTADAGGTYVVGEGATLTLDASASSDPDEATSGLTFEWDLNYDGNTFDVDATGIAPGVSFADNFTARTIAVRVTDSDGEREIATTTLTVNNVAPTLDPLTLSAPTIDENGMVTVNGSFTDPGTLDTHEVVISWGDGSANTVIDLISGERAFSAMHQYLDDNPTGTPQDQYAINVTVTDDDGGSVGTTAALAQQFDPFSIAGSVNFAGAVTGNLEFAQTFTAEAAGTLTGVEVFVNGSGAVSDLVVDIRPTTSSGVPSNSAASNMASVTIPRQNVPDSYGFIPVDLSAFSLSVAPGEVLAIVIRPADPAAPGQYNVGGQPGDPFVNGRAYFQSTALQIGFSSTNADIGFKTFIRALTPLSISVANVAPTVDAGTDATINEGSAFTGSGSFTDPGADSWSATVDYGDGSSVQTLALNADKTFGLNHTYADDGAYTVTVTVTDDDGGGGTDTVVITVNNLNPEDVVIDSAVNEYVFAVGGSRTFAGAFTDPGTADTHTAVWTFSHVVGTTVVTETRGGTVSQGAGSGTASDSFVFDNDATNQDGAGVYTVTLTVTDDDSGTATSESRTFVVYDPSEGFVTGGGWIDSPAGAYVPDAGLTGKATFGFVSKYKKGQSTPSGNTTFQFKVADLEFKSSSYDWLVVAGARAQYKGEGTINGAGNYGFLLTVIDGQVNGGGGTDKFRMKIWDKDNGDAVVYDNALGASDDDAPPTVLGGGSVIIHDNGNALHAAAEATGTGAIAALSYNVLDPVVERAIAYWSAAGADAHDLDALRGIDVQVADLTGSLLGMASESNLVWIDVNGAGSGWGGDGYDLLSAVTHELGHVLGLDHDHGGVMDEILFEGVDRMSDAQQQPTTILPSGGGLWDSPTTAGDKPITEPVEPALVPVTQSLQRFDDDFVWSLLTDDGDGPAEEFEFAASDREGDFDPDELFADFNGSLADALVAV